jgi:hypothetical protein
MLVAQLCASSDLDHMKGLHAVDFVYIRKERKKSGTKQQLEATQNYTSRTSDSPCIEGATVTVITISGMRLNWRFFVNRNMFLNCYSTLCR